MKIFKQQQLKSKNTFGIPALANTYVMLEDKEDLNQAIALAKQEGKELRVLGGGSNVLFTQNTDDIIVHPAFKSYQLISENKDAVEVEVEAGMNWHEWVLCCLENGWYGLENLSLIPGLVGAAPIQNIGAYGIEVKDRITQVCYRELTTGKEHWVKNSDCNFGYRDSIFKGPLKGQILICSVRFLLTKSPALNTSYGAIEAELKLMGVESPGPKDVSKAVINIRQSKLPDPKVLGNGGSFFKNPVIEKAVVNELLISYPNMPQYPVADDKVKLAAGWLIEQAGWKGKSDGTCGVHDRQALVLVNYGEASGSEIKALAYKVIDSVKEKFGIALEPEVNIW